MTVRQLEEQTGCKIMVRGRGSIKVSGISKKGIVEIGKDSRPWF